MLAVYVCIDDGACILMGNHHDIGWQYHGILIYTMKLNDYILRYRGIYNRILRYLTYAVVFMDLIHLQNHVSMVLPGIFLLVY